MNPTSCAKKLRARIIHVALASACTVAAGTSTAEVIEYDFRQPIRDGVILVGMECNRNSQSLEFGIFEGAYPPTKRMDLWNTSDLVTYDAQTNMVSSIRYVERRCNIGKDRYRLRFAGLPGAPNAMSICGAIITATASVWKNGKLIYEQRLLPCGVEGAIRLARFVSGGDIPTVLRERG
jgi:hypothetical protein